MEERVGKRYVIRHVPIFKNSRNENSQRGPPTAVRGTMRYQNVHPKGDLVDLDHYQLLDQRNVIKGGPVDAWSPAR